MIQSVLRRACQWGIVVAAGAGAAGCSSAVHQNTQALTPIQDPTRAQRLDHVLPSRDFVGAAPSRFEWTAVPGADSYSLGIWNEVDVMIWRQNGITATSVARSEELRLEPGTYMWSVAALRGGEQIADSGLSAFVVRTP